MIRYQLKCDNDHRFEAWFLDGASFDVQAAAGDVTCPHCGDIRVSKAPMAPNLAPNGGAGRAAHGADAGDGTGTEGADGPPVDDRDAEIRANAVAERILDAVDGLRRHVEENFDYVGDDFADEAKRIHRGDADPHDIYGEASADEIDELDDEGVDFSPLPPGRRRN